MRAVASAQLELVWSAPTVARHEPRSAAETTRPVSLHSEDWPPRTSFWERRVQASLFARPNIHEVRLADKWLIVLAVDTGHMWQPVLYLRASRASIAIEAATRLMSDTHLVEQPWIVELLDRAGLLTRLGGCTWRLEVRREGATVARRTWSFYAGDGWIFQS